MKNEVIKKPKGGESDRNQLNFTTHLKLLFLSGLALKLILKYWGIVKRLLLKHSSLHLKLS